MPIDVDNNNAIINEVLEEWSQLSLAQLMTSLDAAGLELTEDLMNSLRVEVRKAAAGELAKANFYFRMHGRFKDMRTVYGSYSGSWRQKGFAPVQVMEDFIKKVGLEKFKYIPGYKMGNIPSENIAVRRLAWGIAIGRAKKNTIKAKKWYAKTFYSQITPLMEKLGAAARERTAAQIKEGLENDTK